MPVLTGGGMAIAMEARQPQALSPEPLLVAQLSQVPTGAITSIVTAIAIATDADAYTSVIATAMRAISGGHRDHFTGIAHVVMYNDTLFAKNEIAEKSCACAIIAHSAPFFVAVPVHHQHYRCALISFH